MANININYNADGTVSINFQYDSRILQYCKRFLKGATYNAANKSWNLSQVEGNESSIDLFIKATQEWNQIDITDLRVVEVETEEAVIAEPTISFAQCASCDLEGFAEDFESVPPVESPEWQALAEQHGTGCEWVETQAFRMAV